MSYQMNWLDTDSATSSPESGDGRSPCDTPAGPKTAPSGPDRALVSLSARQAEEMGLLTSGMNGPTGSTLSQQSDLQRSLANRLRRLTGWTGSTLYALTWKVRRTPLGRPISALRASGLRTNGKGSSSGPTIRNLMRGWPTARTADAVAGPDYAIEDRMESGGKSLPTSAALAGWSTASSRDWKDSPGMAVEATNPDGSTRTRTDQLPRQTLLAGWPTVTATDALKQGEVSPRPGMMGLSETAPLSGWPTADAQAMNVAADPEKHQARRERLREKHGNGNGAGLPIGQAAHLATPARLTVSGEMLTGSSAEMESGGQLDPAHSRWLMGFPDVWDSCGATAMQSFLKSQRRS